MITNNTSYTCNNEKRIVVIKSMLQLFQRAFNSVLGDRACIEYLIAGGDRYD